MIGGINVIQYNREDITWQCRKTGETEIFCDASELLLYIVFILKINKKRVILVDCDSWEAEYSLNVAPPKGSVMDLETAKKSLETKLTFASTEREENRQHSPRRTT